MHSLLNIISQAAPTENQTAQTVSQTFLDPISIVFCTVGMCILIGWLFWYGGFRALQKAPVRRHQQRFIYWPLLILTVWILCLLVVNAIINFFFRSLPNPQKETVSYFINAIFEIVLTVIMVVIADKLFVRGLKGFGLTWKPWIKDAGMGGIYLLGVFPLIWGGLFITLLLGRVIAGPEFSLEVHRSLETLTDAHPALQTMIFIFAVLVVPVFEELLFRGFFQTAFYSLSGNRWVAIILTSIFFAILHQPTHIPALFMFSIGLGYAYERSGSLFRPILMHIFFNGFSVAVTILQSS